MNDLYTNIQNCQNCRLHHTRKHVIFGDGNPNAKIVLIGEAPGANEDHIGIPFVGESGQLLDKILSVSGFSRKKHLFITNIVRCRPPGNRTPTTDEVQSCIPYLYRQLELINPEIIITLGATATKYLLNNKTIRISRVRGTWIEWQGKLVMPVYHPAALLRNPSLKKETWEDFKRLILKYRELINSKHHSDYF